MSIRYFISVLGCLSFLACGGGGQDYNPPPGPPTLVPVIQSFEANYVAVPAGGYVTFRAWFSNGGGLITPGNVSITSGSSAQVGPVNASTVFTLTVGSGNTVAKATIPVTILLCLGYYTGLQDSYQAASDFAPYLRMVSSDVFTVQLDGSIAGSDDLNILALDQSQDIETYACVNNYNNAINDFDASLAHAAMVTNQGVLISNLVTLANIGNFDGVNIDFENLAYSADAATDRAAYSAFIHALAAALHEQQLKLIISVPAKTSDSQSDTWSYPFDYEALGTDVDLVQLMTYDEYGPDWSAPGPVSGLDWMDACLQYATTQVAPSKLLIGLPAYGEDWDLTASNPGQGTYSGSSIFWKEMPGLLASSGVQQRWDAATMTPNLLYTSQDGHHHEVWYDNAESIRTKTNLVTQYGLAGISMWCLGEENLDFWKAVIEGLQ
jgi:spore germination protein